MPSYSSIEDDIENFNDKKIFNLSSSFIEKDSFRASKYIRYEDEDFLVYTYNSAPDEMRVVHRYDKPYSENHYYSIDELPEYMKRKIMEAKL